MSDDEEPQAFLTLAPLADVEQYTEWSEEFPNDGRFEYKMMPGWNGINGYYRRLPKRVDPPREWVPCEKNAWQAARLPSHQRGDE